MHLEGDGSAAASCRPQGHLDLLRVEALRGDGLHKLLQLQPVEEGGLPRRVQADHHHMQGLEVGQERCVGGDFCQLVTHGNTVVVGRFLFSFFSLACSETADDVVVWLGVWHLHLLQRCWEGRDWRAPSVTLDCHHQPN